MVGSSLGIDGFCMGFGDVPIRTNLPNLERWTIGRDRWRDGIAMGHASCEGVEAVLAATLEPGHPSIADSRNNLSIALQVQGKYEESEEQARAAIELMSDLRGEDDPDVAALRLNLAALLVKQHDYVGAEVEARAGLPVLVANPGRYPVGVARRMLVEALFGQQRDREALRLAEEIWAELSGSDALVQRNSVSIRRAATAFILAKILWRIPAPARDRARARSLAKDALAVYRAGETNTMEQAREVEQWLQPRAQGS